MVRKNTIPTGWRNVSPVGQPIPGTRFIAFKVPLKGAINQRLTPNQKFTPKDLIVAMKGLNVELGLIIDLTYTTRYYSSKDLPKTIEYKKLYTIGLEVPDDATILQFKKWVRKFLWENAENEKLIGVHCTNGISRTGYLICRYLIDVEGWDPETAIQAFGEARGHHMDGDIYLTDLRTQPMRSNLGMNLWDADVDIIPLPNEMDGHIGRFPSEEYPRPEKRLYEDDHHHHNDLPGQIQLREFGCINKGPGQQRKPYHDLQFQEDLQPQRQIREKHFSEPQFYDDYQEVHQEDLDFAIRDSEQWQRSFHDNQFCDNLLESAPPRDFVSMGCGQRQRHFPNSDMPIDMQCNRGREQTRRLFYDQQSNDEFQARMQLKGQPFLNTGRGQRMRPFHSYPPHDAMHPPVGDFECVSRGCGKRMRPLLDQHDSELQREMTLEDFDSRDSESRCRPFHDHQSYDDFSEQAQSKEFVHSGPEQRMRPFNDHSPHDELSCEGYLDRWQSLSPRDHFPDNPLFNQRHKEDYNRNYRDDCPEDYRRICLSDEINRGEKSRFAPYPSHPGHHLSSAHQKVCSVSADYGREPQNDISREMDRGKRLPFVTIDYNYGLPLDCASEEEDRAHYDLPSREHYIWN